MPQIEPDTRSPERRRKDDSIAAEPLMPLPDVSPDVEGMPMENLLRPDDSRPIALRGIVENGVIRLEGGAKLPEQARVIVVARSA